jgi:hypothetical protein
MGFEAAHIVQYSYRNQGPVIIAHAESNNATEGRAQA